MPFFRQFQHLLPRSQAWRTTVDKTLRKFFEGLAAGAPSDSREFIDDVYLDLFPDTTRELATWETQFGLAPAASIAEETRRTALAAEWAATGGQSPSYIQGTLQAAGFDVYVHEPWTRDRSAFDLSGAYYVRSFDASAQVSTSRTAVVFGDRGSRMYVVEDFLSEKVYEYALSVPYDISTAAYTGSSLSVTSQDAGPTGLAIHPDGTKLYVIGRINDRVYAYDLSTAWDLSTASYAEQSLDLSTQESFPRSVAFKTDGTKFYVIGDNSGTVYQYGMTTAWDVSTASYDSVSLNVGEAGTGLFWGPSGYSLFVNKSSSDVIAKYALTTAWDLTTAASAGSFDVSDRSPATYGLTFGGNGGQAPGYDNGTKMFLGSEDGVVYQYSVADYEPKDPRDYTTQPFVSTYQCTAEGTGGPECADDSYRFTGQPQCNSLLGNEVGYLVNKDLTRRAPPPVPSDPDTWPHFFYLSGATFGGIVNIDSSRREEFERLVLKISPAHAWVVTIVNYVDILVTESGNALITESGNTLSV